MGSLTVLSLFAPYRAVLGFDGKCGCLGGFDGDDCSQGQETACIGDCHFWRPQPLNWNAFAKRLASVLLFEAMYPLLRSAHAQLT